MKEIDELPYDYATNDYDLEKDINNQKSEAVKNLIQNFKNMPRIIIYEKN